MNHPEKDFGMVKQKSNPKKYITESNEQLTICCFKGPEQKLNVSRRKKTGGNPVV